VVYSEDFSSIDMKSIGSSNEKLPAIGVGTKGIQDFKVAEEALSYAFNLGLKLVEVSDSYGEGLAQELVGRVIKKFKRDEIFVVLRIDSIKFSDAESAVKAVSNSLHRMGVSYVDVVISAGLNEIAGLSMQIKSLEVLIDKGLTRYIGLGDLKLGELKKAIELTSKHNISFLQYKYSIINKRIEKDVMQLATKNNIAVLACSPLEKGAVKSHPKLVNIAAKYNKTPVQVAINYLISRPCVIATPKSERKYHIDEIYGALGWKLSIEDIKYLGGTI